MSSEDEWERLLEAERHLQALLPGTVLVGGTAAALHAHHRRSLDGDRVLADLRERLDTVLEGLEQADGVQTGIRQLRRAAPLETELIQGLRVPTLAEMARIKCWLLVTRHSVRDYLDTVVLLTRLTDAPAVAACGRLDELYPQASGASVQAELIQRLAAGAPTDLARVDLHSYKGLVPPWNDWAHVSAEGARLAAVLAAATLEHTP